MRCRLPKRSSETLDSSFMNSGEEAPVWEEKRRNEKNGPLKKNRRVENCRRKNRKRSICKVSHAANAEWAKRTRERDRERQEKKGKKDVLCIVRLIVSLRSTIKIGIIFVDIVFPFLLNWLSLSLSLSLCD